jgi:hypothetical protein
MLVLAMGCKAPPTPVPTDTEVVDTSVPTGPDTAGPTADTGPPVVLPCVDDPLEPNDTPSTAIPSLGESDVVVCVDSDDYWAVDVPADAAVEVRITFDHAQGDIDASLRTSDGQQVDTSTSLDDVETLSWVNDGPDDTVTVRVHLFSVVSGPSNLYDFEATVCVDDADEPNDTLEDATPGGTQNGRTLIFGNEDWYAFEVPAGEVATVTLEHAPDADLDVTLWRDADPMPVELASASGPTSPEVVQWVNAGGAPESVFAQITYWSGADGTCADYDLTVDAEPLDCPADPREPNDSPAMAGLTLAPGGESGLTVSLVDEDFVALDAPGGSVTELVVSADPPGSAVLEVLDGNQNVLASGSPVVYGAAAQTARVALASGVCATYSLDSTDLTPDCTPDPAEPDDTVADAPAVVDGPANVGPDADFAAVGLGAGEAVAVVAEVDPRLGALALSWSEDGSLAQAAIGSRVAVGRPNPGAAANAVVQIEADSALGACLPYTLQTIRQPCGANDSLEPNDTVATAALLSDAPSLLLADGEVDVFATTVDPGDTLGLRVSFLHVLGDIEARLVTGQGVVLDTSSSVSDNETVTWTNPFSAPQDVYLEVFHSAPPGCTTPYALAVLP